MALIVCQECGGKVSTDAIACPGCGAKPKPPKAQWNVPGIIILGGLLILIFAFGPSNTPPQTQGSKQTTAVFKDAQSQAKATTAKPNAPTNKLSTDVDERTVFGGVKLLKMNMRDPSSFQLESAELMQNKAICYTYRAKNGFGGLNLEHAVIGHDGKSFLTQGMDGFTTVWNRDCAQKHGQDFASEINAILPLDK